jgi:membrane associated rhomboid family serine protease
MGYVAYEQWRRGIDPLRGGIGGLILINLVIGFIPSFNIAVGAHIGGLITGVVTAFVFAEADRRRLSWLGYAFCAVLVVGAVLGSIAVSGNVHDYRL